MVTTRISIQCTSCGGTTTVTRSPGMTSATCQYCDSAIELPPEPQSTSAGQPPVHPPRGRGSRRGRAARGRGPRPGHHPPPVAGNDFDDFHVDPSVNRFLTNIVQLVGFLVVLLIIIIQLL